MAASDNPCSRAVYSAAFAIVAGSNETTTTIIGCSNSARSAAARLDKSLTEWMTALAAQDAKYAPTVESGEEKAIYSGYQAAWKAYLESAQQALTVVGLITSITSTRRLAIAGRPTPRPDQQKAPPGANRRVFQFSRPDRCGAPG
jgi:hypothetical protein